MNRITTTSLEQTLPNQQFYLEKPISNVVTMKIRLLSATSLTSTGSYLWLNCDLVSRTNVPLPTVFGLQQCQAWRETYPIPTSRADQLEPLTFYIQAGAAAANDITSVNLQLRSTGTITPGFSLLWEIEWLIGGPDNLLSPY